MAGCKALGFRGFGFQFIQDLEKFRVLGFWVLRLSGFSALVF